MDTDDWRMEDITELRNQRDKLLAELKLLVENLDEYWYEVDIGEEIGIGGNDMSIVNPSF